MKNSGNILTGAPAVLLLLMLNFGSAQENMIRIGKLWVGTEEFPYLTPFGYMGYMDYPGGSEDYYVSLFSLIITCNDNTGNTLVVDMGSNTASGSGVTPWNLQQRDNLNEEWDIHDSDDISTFWEANASFNGNPVDIELNTKIRMWGIEQYDDFVIVQYTFTNTGLEDYTDFWLASSMPAEMGEKTVANRNGDDVVVYDSQIGLAYMRDDDGDNGLSPYWLGQALLKAAPVSGTSDDVETVDQGWESMHYFNWSSIPSSSQSLAARIREVLTGDVETSDGVWDTFNGVGPYTLLAGGDLEFTICYVYGDGEGLLQNLENAKSLLVSNFQAPESKIPPKPPTISVSVNGKELHVSWTGEEAELEADFMGYNLYKSDLSPLGPWRLIFEDTALPTRQYIDQAQIGYQNFYAVTALDNAGNESSLYAPKSVTQSGFEAANPPGTSLDNILIVPNPYVGNATWEINDYENKILFSHLPESCKISIFSVSGDLVDEIYHNQLGDLSIDSNPTGDEYWDLISRNQQAIASGLYIYLVESSDGKTKTGTFAIIKGEK